MTKFYSLALAFMVSFAAVAQQKPAVKKHYTESRLTPIHHISKDSPAPMQGTKKKLHSNMAIGAHNKSMQQWEQIIGYTTYDNQTNNSMQTRIILDDQDVAHATWTMSFENNTQWTDRGTGYNSGQGLVWGEDPYDRLEEERTGWPALLLTGDNAEVYIYHTGEGAPSMAKRATPGSGTWTFSQLPTALENNFLWTKAVSDGNSIHVIASAEPTQLDGTAINGISGNIVYWRSDDNGATWAVQDHVFAEISSDEYEYIGADSYSMDARNGHVSIALFAELEDSIILTSADGGDSWTKTVFMNFPIEGYTFDEYTDIELDGELDTIMSTDGTGSILIDGNGVTHLTFGEFYFYDNTPGDTLYSVFLTDRLLYWNSTYETDSLYVIGTVQESPDPAFFISIALAPDYRAGLASMPTMGEDNNGNLYVVFSAADEEYVGDQVFRHLFAVKSSNGGEDWSEQYEITPDLDFDGYEYVFPSMVKHFTDMIHLVAQRDFEPGLIVRGDLDDSEENEIVYVAVSTSDLVISTPEITPVVDFNVFPNPSNGMIGITGNNLSGMYVKVFDNTGRMLVNTRMNKSHNIGDKQVFDFSFLPSGIYTLSLSNGVEAVNKEIVIRK